MNNDGILEMIERMWMDEKMMDIVVEMTAENETWKCPFLLKIMYWQLNFLCKM